MSKSIEAMQRQIELHLNTISADQRVFGTILQVFLLNMCGKVGQGHELFGSIREQVLATIQNTQPGEGDEAQGSERSKQLTKARADEFFHVLAEALGVKPDKPAPSDVN